MIKKILSVTFVIALTASAAFAASPRKIAYERGENILVADVDGIDSAFRQTVKLC